MSDLLPVKAALTPLPDPGYPALGCNPGEEERSTASLAPLWRFLYFLRALWWVPVLTLSLAVCAAVCYVLFLAPPKYVSYARMWETEKLALPGGAVFTADLQNYLGTQMELLRSDKLRYLALAQLRASGTNNIPMDKSGKAVLVGVTVSQAPKSTVFVVAASSPDADYSQAFLNALMNGYQEYKKSIRKVVSGDTLNSISAQVGRLDNDLKIAQDALNAFQRSNNLAVLTEQGAIAGSHLTKLKTQLSDLELELQLLDATALELSVAQSGGTNTGVDLAGAIRRGVSGMASDAPSDRLTAFQEVALLKIQREKLSKNLRPKHPKIVKLDADIERAQKLIGLFQEQSRDQLAASQQAIRMRIQSVRASIQEWQTNVVQANSLIAEAERLKLDVSRAQSYYDRVQALLQNVDISRNLDQETLAILENASPAKRSYRLEMMALVLGTIVGVLSGLGFVFLVSVIDDRVTCLSEVTDKLADNIVGQVPEIRPPHPGSPLPLLSQDDQRYAYAESYRSLRSALLYSPIEPGKERCKVLLITSALPGEGKSTIAANLAIAMALGGSRVLLVDAELRKGNLHELLGVESSPGLSDLLQKSASRLRRTMGMPRRVSPSRSNAVVHKSSLPDFTFLPRGTGAGNPSDLFLSAELGRALARWRKLFDYILIDSGSVFAADDATTLAPKVDGTLFVVRRRVSRMKESWAALELLLKRQAKVMGIIFNGADSSTHAQYHREESGSGLGQPPAIHRNGGSGAEVEQTVTARHENGGDGLEPGNGQYPHRERFYAPSADEAQGTHNNGSSRTGSNQPQAAE